MKLNNNGYNKERVAPLHKLSINYFQSIILYQNKRITTLNTYNELILGYHIYSDVPVH